MISMGYISRLLAVHAEKSSVCKAKKVGIFKPALLCRDYQWFRTRKTKILTAGIYRFSHISTGWIISVQALIISTPFHGI